MAVHLRRGGDHPGSYAARLRLEIFDDMLAKLTDAGTRKPVASAAEEGP
jgi:hypothetical protein